MSGAVTAAILTAVNSFAAFIPFRLPVWAGLRLAVTLLLLPALLIVTIYMHTCSKSRLKCHQQ